MNKQCPHCNIQWEAEETIYEHFLCAYDGDEKKARHTASMYGCTPENPKHFSINHHGIEILGKYDGVSFWKCDSCQTVFNRWTMEEVKNFS